MAYGLMDRESPCVVPSAAISSSPPVMKRRAGSLIGVYHVDSQGRTQHSDIM